MPAKYRHLIIEVNDIEWFIDKFKAMLKSHAGRFTWHHTDDE
jgi:hypothetical protein